MLELGIWSFRLGTRDMPGFDVQSQFAQQSHIDIRRRIFCGEKFVPVRKGIRAGKKAERLTFAGEPGATGRQPDPRHGLSHGDHSFDIRHSSFVIQFTHMPPCEVRIGSSSIMN
jgi:hypothetical protein